MENKTPAYQLLCDSLKLRVRECDDTTIVNLKRGGINPIRLSIGFDGACRMPCLVASFLPPHTSHRHDAGCRGAGVDRVDDAITITVEMRARPGR